MRVLVTGGAGFIGSNLVRRLLLDEHVVTVVDDLSTGHIENIPNGVGFECLDILDASLPSVVAACSPDAVVHLAAQASVPYSLKHPERDWAVNAEGTRRVGRAAVEAGARRVISASSAAVYGEPAELPLAESSPKAPVNPYGSSKLAAESLLAEELAHSGVDHASFRFSNVFGPRQDALGEGGVVAIFCHDLATGATPTIFGTGEQTRDFIFVEDVVSAIVAALDLGASLRSGPEGEAVAFNISTGREMSVSDLGRRLLAASGGSANFRHEPARDGDVERSVLDPAAAQRAFGWRAAASLDDALEATWRWFAGQDGV